jgi:uncharacterized protein YndB with AHSA1/START domain
MAPRSGVGGVQRRTLNPSLVVNARGGPRYRAAMNDLANDAPQWPEYRCRSEAVIAAAPDAVWAALVDLAAWAEWWSVVRVEPVDPDAGTVLRPGLRFRIVGNRPGGPTRGWMVDVLDVVANERIDLLYAEGDLRGRTSWELTPAPGGTAVAYVYHGVRPMNAQTATSWLRWGTGVHECATRIDTLPGLARYVLGEPLDDAWRAQVQVAMAECVAALPVLED